jgi:hypothetical protein
MRREHPDDLGLVALSNAKNITRTRSRQTESEQAWAWFKEGL